MRKEGLPFPCLEPGCKQSFRSKGDRKRHSKAAHPRAVEGIRVHSFGDLEQAINQRNVKMPVNMPPGPRRGTLDARKAKFGIVLAISLFIALIGSLAALSWLSKQDNLSGQAVDDTPRPVTTTVVKPPQK